jgi:hypothetical protein
MRGLGASKLLGIALAAGMTAGCLFTSPQGGGIGVVAPGIYERMDTLQYVQLPEPNPDGPFYTQGLRRTRLQIRADGTYLHQEFFTAPDSSVVDFRFMEERGSIRQIDSMLDLTEITRFTREPLVGSLGYRSDYTHDGYTLLHVDAGGFRTRWSYYDQHVWRRIEIPDLQPDPMRTDVYVDPRAGFSIRLPEAWYNQVRSSINSTTYDFSSSESIPGGRDGTASLIARTTAKNPGETLDQRMDAEIKAVSEWFLAPVTVLARTTTVRDGRTRVEAVIRVTNSLSVQVYIYREKLVLFEGKTGAFTFIRYLDHDDLYDANTVFPAIDSSLTFF